MSNVNNSAATARVRAPAVVPTSSVAVPNVAQAHAVQPETPMAPAIARSAVTDSGTRRPGAATVKDAMLRQLKAEYPRDDKATKVARSLIVGYLRDTQKTAVQVLRSPVELARCAEKTSLSCGVIRAAMWSDVQHMENALFFASVFPSQKPDRGTDEIESVAATIMRNDDVLSFSDGLFFGLHEATHAEGALSHRSDGVSADKTSAKYLSQKAAVQRELQATRMTPQQMIESPDRLEQASQRLALSTGSLKEFLVEAGAIQSPNPNRFLSIEDETWANFHTAVYSHIVPYESDGSREDLPAGKYICIHQNIGQFYQEENCPLWTGVRQTTRAYLIRSLPPYSPIIPYIEDRMYQFIHTGVRDAIFDSVEPEIQEGCAKSGATFSFESLRASCKEVEAYFQANFLSEPHVIVDDVRYFPVGGRMSALEEFHARMVSALLSLSPSYGDNMRPRASLSPSEAAQVELDISAFYALERATSPTKHTRETHDLLQAAYARIDGKVELSWGYCALPAAT
jgi:hypothetical protein